MSQGDPQQDAALADLFKRAAVIAGAVPEAMQDAAFHRALDMLQGTPAQQSRHSEHDPAENKSRPVQRSQSSKTHADPAESLKSLDRSKLSDVDDETEDALAKSLALLRVAHRELDIDGLTGPQIAKVLTEKLRWRVSRQAVVERLDKAGRLVDRVAGSKGAAIYKLMSAGEKYLDTPHGERKLEPTSQARRGKGKPKTTARKSQSATASTDVNQDSVGDETESKRKRRSGRTGPKQAVEALITDGYFAQPRTIQQVREQLEHNQGLRFKPNDLSPAMTRLLREKKLTRVKNTENQYEYSTPSA